MSDGAAVSPLPILGPGAKPDSRMAMRRGTRTVLLPSANEEKKIGSATVQPRNSPFADYFRSHLCLGGRSAEIEAWKAC
jgi:hypothetical protein